jgi:hypothetical protein
MAGLLASLHYILVLLALGAAFLSLALESRITTKLYKYFIKKLRKNGSANISAIYLCSPGTQKK